MWENKVTLKIGQQKQYHPYAKIKMNENKQIEYSGTKSSFVKYILYMLLGQKQK